MEVHRLWRTQRFAGMLQEPVGFDVVMPQIQRDNFCTMLDPIIYLLIFQYGRGLPDD